MVNLTAMWVAAGRPEGRRPSNFKATAAIKRLLTSNPSEWLVTGRGANATTSASERLADEFKAYVRTPKRGSTKATSTGSTTGSTTGDEDRRYTAADMRAAYQGGYKDGHEIGYTDGYANGKRAAGTFGFGDAKFTATKQQCTDARKTFARKYHPDHNPGGLRDMQIINAVFDEIERIFHRAA